MERKVSLLGIGSFALLLVFLATPWRAVFGQAATSHSITLTWTASTTTGVTYTVYRATAAAGPFTPIATGVSAVTFIDTTAVDGTQYFYEVDSVTSGGTSSGPSNEANATEPVNPNPPTGLVAVSQ
jgi:fibronectin type 3 domain-containing protein